MSQIVRKTVDRCFLVLDPEHWAGIALALRRRGRQRQWSPRAMTTKNRETIRLGTFVAVEVRKTNALTSPSECYHSLTDSVAAPRV